MAQSKVGRVPYVRDAPPSIRPETVRRAEDCQSYRGSCHSAHPSGAQFEMCQMPEGFNGGFTAHR